MEDLFGDVPVVEKITPPIMYIFEKTEIIKKRVKQLNDGYKTTIPDLVREKGIHRSIDIAFLEFAEGKIPVYEIKRKLGGGHYEIWKHDDFKFYPDDQKVKHRLENDL